VDALPVPVPSPEDLDELFIDTGLEQLIYWEERAGLLTASKLAVPSWHRIVGLTLRARAGISPAARALIDTLREVGGEFGS
jgi:hypothetical protein